LIFGIGEYNLLKSCHPLWWGKKSIRKHKSIRWSPIEGHLKAREWLETDIGIIVE